ncbi:hypothetical protein BC940DRAFT_351869 [Gongronella butleri]|nr:hypothetical protein BC940DRAFT_351869 [Gongronella butleri]
MSMKRPRAPIACYRCHHKKPHHVDPYIESLSLLEHQIQQIESDMNDYRGRLLTTLASVSSKSTNGLASSANSTSSSTSATVVGGSLSTTTKDASSALQKEEDRLRSHLQQTEQDVQESRTILAQLRLRGEQRIARSKRNQAKETKHQRGGGGSGNGHAQADIGKKMGRRATMAATTNASHHQHHPHGQFHPHHRGSLPGGVPGTGNGNGNSSNALVAAGNSTHPHPTEYYDFFPPSHVPPSAIATENMHLMMYNAHATYDVANATGPPPSSSSLSPPPPPTPSSNNPPSSASTTQQEYPNLYTSTSNSVYYMAMDANVDDDAVAAALGTPHPTATPSTVEYDAMLHYPWTAQPPSYNKDEPQQEYAPQTTVTSMEEASRLAHALSFGVNASESTAAAAAYYG